MAELVLSGVRKRYSAANRDAVANIDLRIDDGELAVLVGPSGCGKTTLLRLIAGLERPDHGVISIGGQSMASLTPGERHVAFVAQEAPLYPHMTVRGNLALAVRYHGVASHEIQRRVHEVAHLLDISGLLERLPATLSGGQRQRVALGRALMRTPDAQVMLLDEPLAGLDPGARTSLRAEFKHLRQRIGTTTVYVTHDQAEAMALGDRIAVMTDGTIRQFASPMDVYRQPADAFVASFMGSPGMNLVRGTIEARETATVFVSEGDDIVPLDKGPKPSPGSIVLGIRPEHIHIVASSNDEIGHGSLRGLVSHCEPQGSHSLICVKTPGGTSIVAWIPGTGQFRISQPIWAILDPSKLHFFGADLPGRRFIT